MSTCPWFDPSSDEASDDEVCILTVGEPFRYTIPSFDVLAVELRQVRIKGYTNDEVEQNYDAFMRNEPSLCRSYPTWVTIKDCTLIDEQEFNICVKTVHMKLFPQGVLTIWQWEWSGSDVSSRDSQCSSSDLCEEGEDHYDPYINSDSDKQSEDESESSTPFSLQSQTHIVIFKCMGTTHDLQYQEHLKKASKLLAKNVPVPVKLLPEPTNAYDSKAIAFYCKLDNHWHKVGYVVKEVLSHVHQAIEENIYIFVKFSWVKYLVIWSRCGPGYYVGVNIAVRGEWHKDVTKYASTR